MRPPVGSPSGSISSSPPERTATRGRWWTATLLRPSDASMPSAAGPSRAPASSTTSPACTSSPAGRTFSPAGRRREKRAARAVALDVLLPHDRVGAGRDRRAREDPRDLPRCERRAARARRRPRRRPAARRAPRGRACQIGGADRVAVHGRDVVRRQRATRRHRLGEHAPERAAGRARLGRQRGDRVENRLLRAAVASRSASRSS